MHAALARLRHTVESFVDYINSLPPRQLAPASWGPREVLVHLVFWHETFVSTIQALLDQREPSLPRWEALAIRAADRPLAIPVKAGSHTRTFDQLVVEAEAHIRNHEHKLRSSAAFSVN